MVGSIVYGMALVIIGLDIYLANLFVGGMNVRHIAEWYGLYLSIVGGAFIIWLLIDIQHYIGSIGKYKTSQSSGQMQLVIGEDGELCLEIPLEEEREKLPEYYGFTRGRHAGSFFLKIGAFIFCCGHIIHLLLNFAKQVSYFTIDNSTMVDECASEHVLVFDIIDPIFISVQLYMIFKFSNVIINRRRNIAR